MPILSTDTINRYIATQGPLPSTCDAFWRMIWEDNCSLIIMLTTLFEKFDRKKNRLFFFIENFLFLFFSGRVKCHQYWPDEEQSAAYGSFTLRCNRERKENDLIYRELFLFNEETNQERTVYQIQNETWPDHGVPTEYQSFVNFILEIRELRKANKHLPILVHCRSDLVFFKFI